VKKMDAAPFCTSNGSFPLRQFWRCGRMASRTIEVEMQTFASNISRFCGMLLA
jgi:hypothetical protein